MSPQLALDLVYKAIFTTAKMAAPIMISAIVIGVIINIVQTVTSIRDTSLTFVPKMVVAAVVMGLSLPWMLELMQAYFQEMFLMCGALTP